MAEQNRSIFNQKATDQLRSPDDLDKYVKVTNPGVWVILLACAFLLAGVLAWGIFGTVSTNVSGLGARDGDRVVCLLDSARMSQVSVGDSVNAGGLALTVEDISSLPLSRDEAGELLGSDYLESTLVESDWVYVIIITGDGVDTLTEGIPIPVSITVESVAPISLVFGA